MRSLNGILSLSETEEIVEVEAGAQWKDIVNYTFLKQRIPLSLTHVLDTTVGGTLSVAGVGGESWRVGPQVDNVKYLDVLTMDGVVVRCDRNENRALFDAARAGLGQCGAIIRVAYPVRRCSRRIKSRWLLYRDVDRFMRDVEFVCSGTHAAFVSALFVRNPRRPGKWVIALVLGFEHAEEEVVGNVPDLSFDDELPAKDAPLWDSSGLPGHVFFRLHAPSPESIDADPTTLHPWSEHVFGRSAAQRILEEHLRDDHSVLSLGTNGLIFIRRNSEAAPLFKTPEGNLLWGVGIFASIRPSLASDLVPILKEYAVHGQAIGGKRYLSGYLDFSKADHWAEHFDSSWDALWEAKQRFDPRRLLNPGCLVWD